jgi:hypothetical protein
MARVRFWAGDSFLYSTAFRLAGAHQPIRQDPEPLYASAIEGSVDVKERPDIPRNQTRLSCGHWCSPLATSCTDEEFSAMDAYSGASCVVYTARRSGRLRVCKLLGGWLGGWVDSASITESGSQRIQTASLLRLSAKNHWNITTRNSSAPYSQCSADQLTMSLDFFQFT